LDFVVLLIIKIDITNPKIIEKKKENKKKFETIIEEAISIIIKTTNNTPDHNSVFPIYSLDKPSLKNLSFGRGKNLPYNLKTEGFAICGSATRKAAHLVIVQQSLQILGGWRASSRAKLKI